MGRRTRVVLLGNSLILAGLGATLDREGTAEVIRLAPPLPGCPELEEMSPDVVLFDIGKELPVFAFPLLETHPGLLLIGLNPEGNEVCIWSGRQFRELSAGDLLALMEAKRVANDRAANRAPDTPGRGDTAAEPSG